MEYPAEDRSTAPPLFISTPTSSPKLSGILMTCPTPLQDLLPFPVRKRSSSPCISFRSESLLWKKAMCFLFRPTSHRMDTFSCAGD